MRRHILPFVLLVCSSVALVAQTPEQVVTAYFDKMKSGGLNTVASLMHPDELRKFRQMLMPVVESSLAADSKDRIFAIFGDPNSPGKMRALDELQFMNVFMELVLKLNPGMDAMLKDAVIQTLGHVRENDIKHVVVRTKMKGEGLEIEQMSVVSVKDYEGVPKLTLTGEMKGLAEALKRRR